jgi:hypothetical protein
MLGEGFLGRPSTFGADLNLLVQLAVGLALVAGLVLARRARYGAHGACPRPLRFSNYKLWMRTLIVTWWLALLLGVLTYWFATT